MTRPRRTPPARSFSPRRPCRRGARSHEAPRGPRARLGREGFTLVEVLVGILILGVSLLGLAAAAGVVARYSVDAADRSQRVVSSSEEAAALSRLPWEELPTTSECVDIPSTVPMQRCVTVELLGANRRRYTIIVTGIDGADTLQVERARPTGSNPFNVP